MKYSSCASNQQPEDLSLQRARTVLQQEADAISSLAETLGQDFGRAATLIASIPPQGRLVVVGIGKTSFIAMKFSATIASVGVPSFFLHPSEAVHGDLGRVSSSDLVLLLSNSGETREIVRVVPSLRQIGCKLISITSERESFLAANSDISIIIGKLPEVGPFGIAPSTSTTAMLALGDALISAVLEQRPISREQFALYHPGGAIGRTLMAVSEVMRQNEEHCVVHHSTKMREVLHMITLTKGRPGAASIIDDSGHLIGVFTDGDLRRLLDRESDFLERPVADFMTRNPKTVRKDMLAEEALKILSNFKIDQVIVIDNDNVPVGLVDIQDLVQIS